MRPDKNEWQEYRFDLFLNFSENGTKQSGGVFKSDMSEGIEMEGRSGCE